MCCSNDIDPNHRLNGVAKTFRIFSKSIGIYSVCKVRLCVHSVYVIKSMTMFKPAVRVSNSSLLFFVSFD